MSVFHQKYLDFIKNERKTLKYLMDSPIIRKLFPEIAIKAEESYGNLPSKDKDLVKTNFAFESCFKLYIERENRSLTAIVEVQVTRDFGLSNYVLALCENMQAPYNLIRKFHFDYDKSNSIESPKPVYHFQYGGQSTPLLSKMGIEVGTLSPWLSNPRIIFYPINLALLIDLVFYEFVSDDTSNVVNRSEWKEFIKENEKKILKPFYSSINHFNNENHTHLLIRDCLYGK